MEELVNLEFGNYQTGEEFPNPAVSQPIVAARVPTAQTTLGPSRGNSLLAGMAVRAEMAT